MHLRAEEGLRDLRIPLIAVVVMKMSIPKRATSVSHTSLFEERGREIRAEAELTADRLAYPQAVQRAGERIATEFVIVPSCLWRA